MSQNTKQTMQLPEWNPDTLLATSGGYWLGCALQAAVKLDICSVLADGPLSAVEVASALKVGEDGVTRLLNALVAMQLLLKTDGKYANTDAAARYLVKASPQYVGYMILHHHHLLASWHRLAEAIRDEQPVHTQSSHSDSERESFLMGMFNTASNLAPTLVPQVDLGARKHLLDLGGGPGTYAIHFCRHNPHLQATVYDLPTTRPFAEQTIAKFSMAERINFIDGNYLHDDIPGSYDVAWLSNVLHGEGPEDCQMVIDKVVSVLQPGGMIIIHEFILDDSMAGPLFPALFTLNMLLATPNGRSYSAQQLRDMLVAAGIAKVQRLPFRSPKDSGLLLGVV